MNETTNAAVAVPGCYCDSLPRSHYDMPGHKSAKCDFCRGDRVYVAPTVKVTLKGRTYTVAKVASGYVLTGPRGTEYLAMRFHDRPSRLYVTDINCKSARAFAGITLTDADGTLEVATYGHG